MNWKLDRYTISKWITFVVVMTAAILVAGIIAYIKDSRTFWPAILAGLCSGLVTLLIDKCIDRKELQFLHARDHIETTLERRDDQDYYQNLIDEAKRQIDFLGKTGERLLNDFADLNARDPKKTSLLKALDAGVKVRFLLADERSLGLASAKVEVVKTLICAIRDRYPAAKFEVRYYHFEPAFSFFRADDRTVFGPNFPKLSGGSAVDFTSRPTPSVVAGTLSVVAKAYIEFFESTWNGIGNDSPL